MKPISFVFHNRCFYMEMGFAINRMTFEPPKYNKVKMGTSRISSSSCSLSLLLLLLPFFFSQIVVPVYGESSTKRLYIVYMGERQHDDPSLVTASHHETLASVLGSKEEARGSILYSYKHGFSGFSAMITDSQAKQIAKLPGVVHVIRSRELKLQTTRSWDFLGLDYNNPTQLLKKSKWGEDVIIGVIDTGIWPESKSYNDDGYGPIPSRWKGTCKTGEAFNNTNCNRKIIGARWYTGGVEKKYIESDYLSARDMNGHGTMTSSTAAGSLVGNVSFHGIANGTARGGAPRARLAIYKVGWGKTDASGNDAGVLAAIDDAIKDGVDVLSLSLVLWTVSFGALHAVEKGITVVFAGGNSGPVPQIVENVAPWVITVAASTIDRAYPTAITLGSNQTLLGQAQYYGPPVMPDGFKGLVYGVSCDNSSLNGTDVRGSVVLCAAFGKPPISQFITAMTNVVNGGAKGLIFAQYTTNYLELPDAVCQLFKCKERIPVVFVDLEVGMQIGNYLQTASDPVVKISPTVTVVGSDVLSPKVATFSSRGPSAILPAVLKPDIAAPGVSILAARKDSYELGSGTSLSAPHISGIVALLKSVHPNWSPAAIKSALVTSASTTDAYGWPTEAEGSPPKIADPFDFGGGHVNPNGAMDPGLVYDIDPKDYTHFMHCMLLVTAVCNTTQPAYNLNLPSISIPDLRTSVVVRRTVTNVGEVDSTYNISIQPPVGIQMDVKPRTLAFSSTTKKLSFYVTFSTTRKVQGDYRFGSLTWHNGKHSVRIPIAVRTVIQDLYADVA